MTRTEISNLFGHNMSSERIARALSLLLAARRVRRKSHKTGGPTGREVVCSVRTYEIHEKYERSNTTPDLYSFPSFISYHFLG